MPFRFRTTSAFLALPLAAITLNFAHAQGIITGSIAGTVQDAAGAAVVGANIVTHNNATGVDFQMKTGGAGEFTVSDLPIGEYTVTITATGFSETRLNGISVRSGVSSSAGFVKLSVTNSETVEVGTTAAILQTEQSQITTTFDAQEITDLPTGGGLDKLTLLVPGVTRTLNNNYANTNGTGISSNGLRGRSNNFEIDGQSNNDNSVSGPQLFFHNEDALSEVQIVTNNFSAQYGRNAGSVVNYNTKSGTNTFHGSGFYNFVGSWGSSLLQGNKSQLQGFCNPDGSTPTTLGATTCTPISKPRLVANEYGGTLGGPVLHDKLFFFGGTLWRRAAFGASPTTTTTLTPTPNGLKQLQAAFPGNPFVTSLINQGPYSVATGSPTPGSAQMIPVCAQSVTTCPAGSPQVEFAGLTRFVAGPSLDQEHIGRLDYQPTSKDRFFVRYIYQDAPTLVAGGNIAVGNYYNVYNSAHSVGADWTRTFSSRLLNQLRYSFQQTKLVFEGGGYANCTTSNIASCPSNVGITGYLGYGQATNLPQGRIVKVNQLQDNATYSFGRHNILFGGEYDFQNSPNTFLPTTNGSFSFNNFNYALAGNGTLSLANGNPLLPFKEPDVAAYIQDDWKISPQFTMNLGLRWEWFEQSINVVHDISVARQTGSNPIWNTALPLNLTTFPSLPNRYKNFEPRLGFAYNPSSMSGLVVRGGYSINFDPAFYNIFLNAATSSPVVNTGIIQCNGGTIRCLPSGGTTGALVHAQNDANNPTGGNPGAKVQSNVDPGFGNPYVQNYSLGVQYALGKYVVAEARYVGNHATKLFQSINGNADIALAPPSNQIPAYSATAPGGYKTLAQAFPGLFPAGSYCTTAGAIGFGYQDCNRTTVTRRGNYAFSNYNAIQTQLQTRAFHGLTGNVAYTFSRAIDNANEVYSTASVGLISVPQSPFDTNYGERGVSAQSFPNTTAMGLVYTPPVFKDQRGIVGRALGGWQANTIYTFNSGQPWTPYQTTKFASTGSLALAKIPTANQGQALYSFCDYYYNTNALGADSCRPVLANATAPVGTVGINGGPGVGYLNIASGASINRTDVHWLVNNQYEAQALGTPYPGAPRNTQRANTVNELDFAVFKNVTIRESKSLQLRLNVYNLPNRAYYGSPDPNIADANPAVHGKVPYASFGNFLANSGAVISTPGYGRGSRNIQLGGKFTF